MPDHGEQSYRGSGLFDGCAVLITGGDSDIAGVVSITFAREGANVLVSYLEEHGDARITARLVEGAGRRAILVAGDIGVEQVCMDLVKRCI